MNVLELRQIFENYLSFERDLVKISDLSYNSFFPQFLTIMKLKLGIDLNIIINEENYFSTLDINKTNYILDIYKDKKFVYSEINYNSNINFTVLKLSTNNSVINLFFCFDNIDNIYLSIFENIKNLIEDILYKENNKNNLKNIEDKYSSIIEKSNDALVICDFKLKPFLSSNTCHEMFGYSKDEFNSNPNIILNIVDQSHKADIDKFLNNLNANKIPDKPLKCKCIKKDGKTIYIENTFSLLNDENGLPLLQIISKDITDTHETEIDKNKILKVILDNIPAIVWSVSDKGIFQQSFGSGLKTLNLTENEQNGLSIYDIYPDHAESIMSTKEKIENRYLAKGFTDNREWYFDNSIFKDKKRLICFSLDVTEQIQKEEMIKNSLNEKETLLKEIHHRVKNNMQVISSLLSLQSSQIKEKNIKQLFMQSQNRIRSMALVHEILYQSETLSKIDFTKYINELICLLSDSFGKGNVKFEISSKTIYLGIDSAIPAGLIINELVSNSLKYAFKNNTNEPLIKISLAEENNKNIIIIEDNGSGLPANINYKDTSSLGLQLVNSLVNQLSGDIAHTSEQGTKFIISF